MSDLSEIEALNHAFRDAKPFPHMVFDDLLDPGLVAEAAAAYPSLADARKLGRAYDGAEYEDGKVGISDRSCFSPALAKIDAGLASPDWMMFLSAMTGIPKLLPDAQLLGGGMHLMSNTGRLDVHVDFNVDTARGLYRRLNILLFLNREWQPEWGGALELWNEDMSECVFSMQPTLGRVVVFETSEKSYHGVERLNAPLGVVRKSFAAYYYTEEPPPGLAKPHSTVFRRRPWEAA